MNWLLNKSFLLGTVFLLLFSIYTGLYPNEDIDHAVKLILLFYLTAVLFRSVFFFFGSVKEKFDDYSEDSFDDAFPLISIIVPCYNEENVICDTIRSLSHLNYPNYEIVIVDDGSSDSTYGLALTLKSLYSHIKIRVYSQMNQGKSAALNYGLLVATGDLILCVDADSKLHKDSLFRAPRHFKNPKVAAVAGFIEIGNQKNLILKLQQLEYLISLNFTRRALSFLGTVPIVPGPAGLFRRKSILQSGGFNSSKRVFAEDAELSLRLLTRGWQIKSDETLIAITEAPENINDLLRQRYRWNRGTIQALMINLQHLFFASGWRGKWLGGYLFTESIITPLLNFSLILYFFTNFIKTGGFNIFTIWYVYLLVVDILTTTLVTIERGSWAKWMLLTAINKISYFYILLTWKVISLFEEWLDKDMTWDKLERTGSLKGIEFSREST